MPYRSAQLKATLDQPVHRFVSLPRAARGDLVSLFGYIRNREGEDSTKHNAAYPCGTRPKSAASSKWRTPCRRMGLC